MLGKRESHTIVADNRPATNITWREAVTFCRWLSERYKLVSIHIPNAPDNWEIRLPIEREWIVAATQGDEGPQFPWGNEWKSAFANTPESYLGRTTAVGMYPGGQSWIGAMDMSGNIWEWGINMGYWRKRQMVYAGTFHSIKGSANAPTFDGFDLSFNGLRVVCASPVDNLAIQQK